MSDRKKKTISHQMDKMKLSRGTHDQVEETEEDKNFRLHYFPTPFAGTEAETNEKYKRQIKKMTEQHKFIHKIKMFAENRFDMVILGKTNKKNKLMGNMIFKCFLDPLGNVVFDYIGDQYADKLMDANLNLELDEATNSKAIREMLSVKEDKLRYSQVRCTISQLPPTPLTSFIAPLP